MLFPTTITEHHTKSFSYCNKTLKDLQMGNEEIKLFFVLRQHDHLLIKTQRNYTFSRRKGVKESEEQMAEEEYPPENLLFGSR